MYNLEGWGMLAIVAGLMVVGLLVAATAAMAYVSTFDLQSRALGL